MADQSAKRGRGRPTLYTEELAGEIALALESSDQGLWTICGERDDFPAPSTVFLWQREHPEFSERITRAREAQAERLAYKGAQILDAADAYADDKNTAGVTHARNKADYLMKLIPKIAPKVYGDRQAIDLGGQPDAPITFKWADAKPEGDD